MRKTLVDIVTKISVVAVLMTACSKKDGITEPPLQPVPPIDKGSLPIYLKAAITVGDVVYDSIPATFTITTWNVNGVAHRKDTALNPGAQVIYLPKDASRYSLKLQKWGVTEEKMLNKADVTEGALYQLGGRKEAKRLQWVNEYKFENGTFSLSAKQHFEYDAEGRINEVHAYAPDPNDGALRSHSSDLFLYGRNELWVNHTSKKDGTLWYNSAYTFDAQGRTIQSKHRYRTENHIYTNQYTNEGIVMMAGQNAADPNGSRIALRFTGGNRVEEKTIIPGYTTTVKNFRYDFNINPFAVIKMPSLYFEHSSRNNVVAEGWEGSDKLIYEYKYDADGYVTEVISKSQNNGLLHGKTVYTY